jgi:hypothetical protein
MPKNNLFNERVNLGTSHSVLFPPVKEGQQGLDDKQGKHVAPRPSIPRLIPDTLKRPPVGLRGPCCKRISSGTERLSHVDRQTFIQAKNPLIQPRGFCRPTKYNKTLDPVEDF